MYSAKVKDYTIYFENSKEFHILKREIFGEHGYYVEFETETPYIIDAGAHIGMSVVYFKMIAPRARVLAIEPNPLVIPILKKNIFENQLEEIEVVETALATQEGEMEFYRDKSADKWFSTAGVVDGAWNKSQKSEAIRVKTRTLAEFLDRKVDLLKLDIEGAEMKVLLAAGKRIRMVEKVLIEFHGVGDNRIEKIVDFLEANGFGVEVTQGGKVVKPEKVRGLALIEGDRDKF